METDGGDKDSTDNPGEIHSTQQPEDPSEHVSVSRVGLLLFQRFQQHHLSLPDGSVVDKLGTTLQSVVTWRFILC